MSCFPSYSSILIVWIFLFIVFNCEYQVFLQSEPAQNIYFIMEHDTNIYNMHTKMEGQLH